MMKDPKIQSLRCEGKNSEVRRKITQRDNCQRMKFLLFSHLCMILVISLQLVASNENYGRFSIAGCTVNGQKSHLNSKLETKNLLVRGGKRKLPVKSTSQSSSALKTFMIRVKNFFHRFFRRKSHQKKIYSKSNTKTSGISSSKSSLHSVGPSSVSASRNVGTTNRRLIKVSLFSCCFHYYCFCC
jgi:hypothetical protein